MTQRPLLAFTFCWILGSGAACMYSGWQLMLIVTGIAILLVVPFLLGAVAPLFIGCMVASLLVSSGYWEWNDARNVSRLQSLMQKSTNEDDPIPVSAEGVIVSPVKVDGDRADFVLSVRTADSHTGIKEEVQVQVKLLTEVETKTAVEWKRGDSVQITGELKRPGTARNFDGFDYREYLRTKEIHWLLKTKGIQNIAVQQPDEWKLTHVLRWNDEVRQYFGHRIEELFSGIHAGYMKGLIIGDQGDLNPDTFAEFSRLGLTHILAISGLHVAVFVGSLLFVFSLCRLTRETSLTAVMVFLPFYVMLTGASPSIVRAGIMGMIGLYAARRGLLKDGMHILCVAALLMLLWNPYFLVNVSFQLSFLVTAGLMVFVPKLMPFLSLMPRWLAGTLGVTVAAQLVSFPLTIYYFNQFSLLSVLANLLMVPLISMIVLPMGTVALIMGWVWLTGAKWIAGMTEWLNMFTFSVVEWMNGSSVFVTIWPSPGLWWIISYFIVLYLMLYVWGRKKRLDQALSGAVDETVPLSGDEPPGRFAAHRNDNWGGSGHSVKYRTAEWLRSIGLHRLAGVFEHFGSGAAVAVLTGLFFLLLYNGYHGPIKQGVGSVQFLDVGQGDSILVSTPEGKHILIDAGGTTNFKKEKDAWKVRSRPFEVGASVVVPLLKKRGIHSLDMVMVSHNHQDHFGGLQAVLEEIPVKAIIFNGTLAESEAFEKLLKTAVKQDIPVYQADSGTVYRPDTSTEFLFLNAGIDGREQNKEKDTLPVVKDQNHESLVFELVMNEARFLFTGDADAKAEQRILTEHADRIAERSKIRRLDVLKVGHHGSKTSTTDSWLKVWKPASAVISAGVDNMYGHPHPDVVQRIQRNDSLVFRTDLHGEVQMKISRKSEIDVRTRLTSDD
ncbi:ComEC/Rec2 family competence protein [Paenibacillus sp. N3/727]|uniref:ComEC/Rec2 family competence protein n=1 Tax=Paenibacillus sp. N3/727 TaxID=2925845 RepID=UPI001F52E409|nr:ComEC/Rec2 family competence protein [Paenibacillus sp. N3/727]UNK21222.1 ComEC/Rec2 family competence protein [Paenibacillus sp. N3/727]